MGCDRQRICGCVPPVFSFLSSMRMASCTVEYSKHHPAAPQCPVHGHRRYRPPHMNTCIIGYRTMTPLACGYLILACFISPGELNYRQKQNKST